MKPTVFIKSLPQKRRDTARCYRQMRQHRAGVEPVPYQGTPRGQSQDRSMAEVKAP